MKMKESVHTYGLGGKTRKKGLGKQQFHLGDHLKIYIAWETLGPTLECTNYSHHPDTGMLDLQILPSGSPPGG